MALSLRIPAEYWTSPVMGSGAARLLPAAVQRLAGDENTNVRDGSAYAGYDVFTGPGGVVSVIVHREPTSRSVCRPTTRFGPSSSIPRAVGGCCCATCSGRRRPVPGGRRTAAPGSAAGGLDAASAACARHYCVHRRGVSARRQQCRLLGGLQGVRADPGLTAALHAGSTDAARGSQPTRPPGVVDGRRCGSGGGAAVVAGGGAETGIRQRDSAARLRPTGRSARPRRSSVACSARPPGSGRRPRPKLRQASGAPGCARRGSRDSSWRENRRTSRWTRSVCRPAPGWSASG